MSSGTLPRNSGFFTAADTASSWARFFKPGHEQHVDAGRLVGLEPRDGIVDAGDADGAGAADDDEARVLPAGQRRAHLADAFLDGDELRVVAAERRSGSSVSSMVSAETPAVSSSSTVRLTLTAHCRSRGRHRRRAAASRRG